jgi:hypothetical protein
MNFKKVIGVMTSAVIIAGMFVVQGSTVFAADSTVITLDKTASAFTKVEKDLDFQDMEPGEERTAVISLVNNSDAEMSFYISGDMVYNIADAGSADKNAIYQLDMTKDTDTTPFFTGLIGSSENKKIKKANTGLNYLQDNTLLATLAKGDSTTIRIKLSLDGDSAENVYMNKAGKIRINVNASQASPKVFADEETVNPIIKYITVQTGDSSHIVLYLAVAFGALAVAAICMVIKRNSGRNRNGE